MAVKWRVDGGRWMEEPWGEEERAASELDSRIEAWDTASSQFGEECVSSRGDTRATIALAIQEWDDQQQRAATSPLLSMFQRETVDAAMAGTRSEGVLAEEPAVGDSRWWQRARGLAGAAA